MRTARRITLGVEGDPQTHSWKKIARSHMASLAVISAVVLTLTACFLDNAGAAYESAGCSDQGCGIPCYMRPAADSCHYKPFSPCSNEGYDIDLENLILNLNSSLHRLENKLVQKRVSKSKL